MPDAPAAIEHSGSQEKPLWILTTARMAYVFGVDAHGYLQHIYWGPKLLATTDYGDAQPFGSWGHERPAGISAEEFPAWGDLNFNEPCLKATYSDGVRNALLQYDSFEIDANGLDGEQARPSLAVHLRDPHYGLRATLHYRVVPECDIIERSAVLHNESDESIRVERIFSAAWHVPPRDGYRLKTLAGKWSGEFQVQEAIVPVGKQRIESRRGLTGFNASPWFALDANGSADEQQGEVWFGTLAHSGNWAFALERTIHGQVTLSGGVNDFDFEWLLKPGERFETPTFVGGYSGAGYGRASRLLHDYQRQHVLPRAQNGSGNGDAPALRPVLYNSWYVTGFDVTLENQMRAARRAAELGVELFVVDDGWFGRRNDDRAGLGDWHVNPEKFPRGLAPLIEGINELGMGFGLWVEPEMVNPDSDLYRAHPDWVYHFPNRPRSELRSQLVLNLAREDVQAFVLGFMDELLSENKIDFIKWDMNRPFSEPGWPDAPSGRERELWVRHVRGLYRVLGELRRRHPAVAFESCASGGGRIDLGIMPFVEQFWMSDNTDAFDDLFIQEGYSMAFTLAAKMAWVTDPLALNGRVLSLAYRFHSAMTGALGIGANLFHWTDAEMAEAAAFVERYKALRPTIQLGDFYRLRSPRHSPLAAQQFVHKDGHESVVFLFLHASTFGPYRARLQLQGLEPDAFYRVDNSEPLISGRALMRRGLDVALKGDFVSQMMHIVRADDSPIAPD